MMLKQGLFHHIFFWNVILNCKATGKKTNKQSKTKTKKKTTTINKINCGNNWQAEIYMISYDLEILFILNPV